MVALRNLWTPESGLAVLAVSTWIGYGFVVGWAIGLALAAAQPVQQPSPGTGIVLT